ELLGSFYASPGFCDEEISVFLATDLEKGEATPDDGEFLTCEKFALDRLTEMAAEGELKDAKTVIGILMTKNKLL
ncbi:MAG: NUDIX hydrolase, partial [Eubacteriales bacterium]